MRLLDFVESRGNPFLVSVPIVQLHNFVTKRVVAHEDKMRLLAVIENGERAYREFRRERYVEKSKKLSDTISKRSFLNLIS